MNVVDFMDELKEVMKKYQIEKISPTETIGESFIELDKEKDTININGFRFDGKFDHDELEKILIENNADYNMY